MPGLVPAIHGLAGYAAVKTWMPATRTSMTVETILHAYG